MLIKKRVLEGFDVRESSLHEDAPPPSYYVSRETSKQLVKVVVVACRTIIAERPLTLVREAQPLYYARMYMRVWKMRFRIH